jgi:predicted Rossmann fold flavoprotein
VGENPRFARFALKQYRPEHFIALLKQHRIAYHEKHKGQLFCDDSSQQIIDLLTSQCCPEKVKWFRPCQVGEIHQSNGRYLTQLVGSQALSSRYLVVATGGLSIPAIGASDLGYRIAKQFAIPVITPQPALVPLTFKEKDWAPFVSLAGLSMPVQVRTKQIKAVVFDEDLLFTHRGLSGPAILQISSFWKQGEPIILNLLPNINNFTDTLLTTKQGHRQFLGNALTQWMPRRLVDGWMQAHDWQGTFERRFADVPDKFCGSWLWLCKRGK